jgi:hypothetical protein
MTKKFIFTVLLSAIMGGISAQITLRPYVGLTASNYGFAGSGYDSYYESGGFTEEEMVVTKEEYQKNFRSRIGMQVGLGVDIYLTDALSFEPGLRYMQKGAGFFSDASDPDFGIKIEREMKHTFHYLEVPLNLNYQLELGDWKCILTGGPTIGYLADFRLQYNLKSSWMGETEEYKIDTKSESEFKSVVREESLAPFELGINAGLRLEYENFSIYLQYNRSFNEVWIDAPERNQALTLGVGYKIEL